MMADVEAGKAGTIITKDLSRLGRDYLKPVSTLRSYFLTMMSAISLSMITWILSRARMS